MSAQAKSEPVPNFRVIVLYENGGHHLAYTNAAKPWLNQLARDSCFEVKYLTHAAEISDTLLNECDLFIQLDYPPYGWPQKAADAFERYMQEGRGGWIGFHHASLVGEFDG